MDEIKENGLIPGIWFETETCGKDALMYQNQEHLLKRNGQVITSGGRRVLGYAGSLGHRLSGKKDDRFSWKNMDSAM